MKTINPHSLLDKPKTVNINAEINDLYIVWKNLVSEKTTSPTSDFDAFVAGYFLGANSTLKQKYKDYKKFQDKIYN